MLGSEDAFRIFGKKVNEKVFLIRKYYSKPFEPRSPEKLTTTKPMRNIL